MSDIKLITDSILAIIMMLIVGTLLVIPIILVALTPVSLRIYRIRHLASMLKLTYTSNFKLFRFFSSPQYERNVLEGKINGQAVRIYDLYDDEYMKYLPMLSSINNQYYIGRRMTILEFNTVKYFLKENIFGITGLASVRTIKNILKEINEQGVDAKIFRYARIKAPKVTSMMYLLVLVWLIVLIIYFIKE